MTLLASSLMLVRQQQLKTSPFFTPFTYLVTIVLRSAFVLPISTTTGRVQPCYDIVGPH
jgi:hypothetical protein